MNKNTLHLKKVPIIDQNGFQQPVVAATALIPIDWQAHGNVTWHGQYPRYVITNWEAHDPNNNARIQLLPGEDWCESNSGTQLPGLYLKEKITTLPEYLHSFVRRYRKGARVLGYTDSPDNEKTMDSLNRTTPLPGGAEIKTWGQMGEMVIQYDEHGKFFEEIIIASAVFCLNKSISALGDSGPLFEGLGQLFGNFGQKFENFGQKVGDFGRIIAWHGGTLRFFTMRTLVGNLSVDLARTLNSLIQTNPQWEQQASKIREHFNQKLLQTQTQIHNMQMENFRIAREGMNYRHNLNQQTIHSVGAMGQQTWQNQQASNERIHQNIINSIREVEPYQDPVSGRVYEVPQTYKHAWMLNDDTFVLTNNALFNPNVDLGINGQQLRHIKT